MPDASGPGMLGVGGSVLRASSPYPEHGEDGVSAQHPQEPTPIGRAPIDITALDLGGDVVIITDRDGTIVDVNAAFVNVTGFSRTEAIGATPKLLRSGLQAPETYDELWKTVLAGKVWTGQLVDRHRDGRLRTHRVTITPIQGTDGRVSHLVAVQRDLAAQRATPLVASGIGELHTDRTGRCTYLDAEAARLLDTDRDELFAHGWQRALSEDDVAAVEDSMEAVVSGGRSQRLDVRTIEPRWLHLEIAPLTDQRRGTIGTSWHLEDITGDMETHARLARRDAVVTALLETISDPVAVVSADGTVIATNPAWSRGTKATHPLLGAAPGDDLLAVLRVAADRGDEHAPRLARRVKTQLSGMPTASAPPPGVTFHPLANEDGGCVIRIDLTAIPSAGEEAEDDEDRPGTEPAHDR
jgi:PAS domain S-box-containing protein